jgi:FkbM family methyltransferase
MSNPTDVATRVIARLSPRAGMELYWRRQAPLDPAMRLVDEIIAEGDVVVDAGAAYGLFTARFATLVGPSGHVHAFEPDPIKVQRLRSLERRRDWITVYPTGLSDEPGERLLQVPIVKGRHLREQAFVDERPHAHAVTIERLPIVLQRLDDVLVDEPVALIKCDVEGHELPALRGGERLLGEARPRLLLEVEQRHHPEPVWSVFDALSRFGYEGYALRDDELMPLAEFDVERDQTKLLEDSRGGPLPSGYVNNFLFEPISGGPR